MPCVSNLKALIANICAAGSAHARVTVTSGLPDSMYSDSHRLLLGSWALVYHYENLCGYYRVVNKWEMQCHQHVRSPLTCLRDLAHPL